MIDMGKMVKARLESDDGGSLEFQFNPAEYSVKKSATWHTPERSMSTTAGAKPNFVGSNPQTIGLQIFFDDWESQEESVVKDVQLLLHWCAPTRESISNKTPQPPVLHFTWGSNPHLMDHKFYLESVSVKYTMFKPDGTPVRATADISLKEVPEDLGPQNPTSGSLRTRKTHLLSEGDTLQSIAAKEYGNPNLWRGVADFNGIDDPMRLATGTRILLPTKEEAADRR
jgi:nucleoid-associated protein YgaU